MRSLTIVFAMFLVLIVLLALVTAFTSAASGLATGVAGAAASTALAMSQCVSGFMVVVAIVAGVFIGFGIASLRQSPWRRQNWLPTTGVRRVSLQQPGIQALPTHAGAYLLLPHCTERQQIVPVQDPDLDEDSLFNDLLS